MRTPKKLITYIIKVIIWYVRHAFVYTQVPAATLVKKMGGKSNTKLVNIENQSSKKSYQILTYPGKSYLTQTKQTKYEQFEIQ